MSDDRAFGTEDGSLSGSDPSSGTETQRRISELGRLLTSSRRRALLSYLIERGQEPVDRDRLVDTIAEVEHPDPGPTTHRRRIEIALHHVHLPKLVDAELIEYDAVAETVTYQRSRMLERLLATSATLDGSEGA